MPQRLPWSNLRLGLAALATIVVSVVAILKFAGVGRLRGETVRLYVLTNQARGVLHGSEVWLAGQKVGLVEQITFAAPTADTGNRVVIEIEVRAKDAGPIRRDSPAQVRSGANMLGPMVVYLGSGSPSSPGVKNGDTLRAGPQSDMELASVKLDEVTLELPTLMANTRKVVGYLHDTNGTVGAALSSRSGGEVARLRANVAKLRSLYGGSHRSDGGSTDGGLMPHVRSAMARVDSIRTLMTSPSTSFGRFRKDSSLLKHVASARDELVRLSAQLDSSNGTLGRFQTDSSVTRAVSDAKSEMALLFADMRKRPFRYISPF
jgi:phospholipid/cholesterol/gamma-HCH transport system substrate-binding protein